jgi:hypothetical protein
MLAAPLADPHVGEETQELEILGKLRSELDEADVEEDLEEDDWDDENWEDLDDPEELRLDDDGDEDEMKDNLQEYVAEDEGDDGDGW